MSNKDKSAPSIRAASRKSRVYVFRSFVEQHYGRYLKPGDVVLDVAGGKGDLSWLLCNVDHLNSVVIDPRLTHSKHILRSIEYLRANPDVAKERAIPNRPTYQPLAQLLPKLPEGDSFREPRHLRLFLDQHLIQSLKPVKEALGTSTNLSDLPPTNSTEWSGYFDQASSAARKAQPLGYSEEPSNNDATSDANGSPGRQTQPLSDMEGLKAILSAKLILGFHPDQATDFALELAAILQIPYCIVPCCVFPKQFPNRRWKDAPVRTYTELLHYLQSRYPEAQRDSLPFSFTETAKNIVLYTEPTPDEKNDDAGE